MSTLFINEKYYNKLLEPNVEKVLNLYGYLNREDYLKKLINFLNEKYPFLNISNIKFMDEQQARIYSMYNGYIEGNFNDYDEITVSFSDPYTKEGNTIISQQVMPMLQQKISHDINFLLNKRIKKIFLLTSHKASNFDRNSNSIKEDSKGSTLQLLVKCLVTLGFDVYDFIPVINLNTKSRFKNLKDFINNIYYIQNQNSGNIQHKHIELVGNKVVGSFSQKPKGQDEKYFAIRYLTAIMLNQNNIYDVSQAYSISNASQMMSMLQEFSCYVQRFNLNVNSQNILQDDEYKELVEKEDAFLEKLKLLASKYGEDGNKIISSIVRLPKLQAELRKRLIRKHQCKCIMCDIKNEELLIASHIKQSSECNIYEKADDENAFLLCAIHDKLFDRYLISFDETGRILVSDSLNEKELKLCNIEADYVLPANLLTPDRKKYLKWHNEMFYSKNMQ